MPSLPPGTPGTAYGADSYRRGMTFSDFIRDYPALLSTCHSLRASIADGYLLDYLIIDEASQVNLLLAGLAMSYCPGFAMTDIGVTTPYRLQVTKAADVLDQTEADTVHRFQGRQKQVVILSTVLDETWRGRTGLPFVDDPQLINVAVSRAIARFILVTNYDMLPASRHIRDLVGYIRYHNPGQDAADSMVVSVFDLLYRAYSERLRPLAARLRNELKYPSEDIIWTVLHDITAEPRYAHLTVSPSGAGCGTSSPTSAG